MLDRFAKQNPFQSSTMSDYIHEDNLFQILKWLPAESLLRFRTVCKAWKERIDSQSFALDYLSLQNPRLIVDYDPEKEFLALDISILPVLDTMLRLIGPTPEPRFHLANTLHGIVCFYDEIKPQFLLWNPCIRRLTVTPRAKFKSFNWDECDRYSYGTHGGFWIDPCTKNFKVVIFKLPLFEGYDDPIDVSHGGFYSSIEQDWKEISLEEIFSFHNAEVTPPVVIDEVAYWRSFYEYTDDEQQVCIAVVVLLFDFGQEKFGRSQALSVKEGRDLPVLCNWEGAGPALVYVDPGMGSVYLRDGDSWVKMIRIPLRSDISRVVWGMVQVDETSVFVRVLATNKRNELVLLDTKDMTSRVLKVGLKDRAEVVVTYGFVESLLFPPVCYAFI